MSETYSDYIIFIDESGDDTPKYIDKEYPIFSLVFCVFKKKSYSDKFTLKIKQIKVKYFNNENIILHESDIRNKKGEFCVLESKLLEENFMQDLTNVLDTEDFIIISTVFSKETYKDEKITLYHEAFRFCLERIYLFLKEKEQHQLRTQIKIEKREKKLNTRLNKEFTLIVDGKNSLGEQMNFDLLFAEKTENDIGLQIADLVAKPLGNSFHDILQDKHIKETSIDKVIKSKFMKEEITDEWLYTNRS